MEGKTCKRGHLIAGDNEVVYMDARWGKTYVRCRKCTVLRTRERRAKAKAARPTKARPAPHLDEQDQERIRAARILRLIDEKARAVGQPKWVKDDIDRQIRELERL